MEAEVEDLQVKVDAASEQHRGSLIGIQQVQETMKEMGMEVGAEIF